MDYRIDFFVSEYCLKYTMIYQLNSGLSQIQQITSICGIEDYFRIIFREFLLLRSLSWLVRSMCLFYFLSYQLLNIERFSMYQQMQFGYIMCQLLVTVLVSISFGLVKCHTPTQLGMRRVYSTWSSTSLFIIKESHSMNSVD